MGIFMLVQLEHQMANPCKHPLDSRLWTGNCPSEVSETGTRTDLAGTFWAFGGVLATAAELIGRGLAATVESVDET